MDVTKLVKNLVNVLGTFYVIMLLIMLLSVINFCYFFQTFIYGKTLYVIIDRTLNVIERCDSSLHFKKNLCKIDKHIQNIP